MECWPIRFVVGMNGFFAEVKFRNIKELRSGWTKVLPDWPICGIEIKLGQRALWITGAERYSCKVVRDCNGKFLAFDVCWATKDGIEVVRVNSSKKVTRFVLGAKLEAGLEGWMVGTERDGGACVAWRG